MAINAETSAAAIRFQNYFHLVGISFLIWDHILTFGRECRFFWNRRKSTTSTFLFFILRYGALGTNIPVLVFSFVTLPTKTVCLNYDLVHQCFMLLTQVGVSVVMILRIYSLYSRSPRILWSLIGIAVVLMGLTIWAVLKGQRGFAMTVLPGCHLAIFESGSYHLAIPWVALFVFDSVIFGLTIHCAYATRRSMGPNADLPIHRLLVRDGAMYFGATALANLANIFTFFVTGPTAPGSLATSATCMSVTMMTRLMLNLHERTENTDSVFSVSDLRDPSRASAYGGELEFALGTDSQASRASQVVP
ncbi:hypothetical protein FB45DRAFT_1060887 [Roridomyces roridus]|uniref:DUF6533 domain-containing protein n=1 Tax=Roridomyces roridus TaxID=1738132 RepID=A0AAD7BLH0_9AGAR|nr:hypothetical protein FB45DRAFT_1060887 [Roridomyces roridus]